MYDELTKVDIQKMEEEIKYRKSVLAPKLGAELQRTREFGDLSENAEYKEAKRDKRKNESRIRYLEAMIRTARVIDVNETSLGEDRVALFDKVTIFNEKMNAEKEIQIVTTLRQNALLGFVSKESPLGSAIMGAAVGDRVQVTVNENMSYYVKIVKIEKGEDNTELPISNY